MQKSVKIILFIVCGVLLLYLCGFIYSSFINKSNPPIDTSSFWAAEFLDIAGSTVSARTFSGKPIIVNFWASWCEPCVDEMPEFSEFYLKHQNKLQLVGISVESAEMLKVFSKEHKVSYTLLVTPEIAGSERAIEISVDLGNIHMATPYTVVFDAEGNVVLTLLGKVDFKILEKRLKQLQIL